MAYRIAKSLDTLRSQFNERFPGRNKSADGWIGDAAHQSRSSDHNPWVKDGSMGVVTALDITHDPWSGVDNAVITEHMRQKRDSRIKYVICNGRIFSATTSPWTWRAYTGSNPHRTHFHVSVNSTKNHYDDTRSWDIGLGGTGSGEPEQPDEPGTRPVVKKGSKGPHVSTVQRLLKQRVDADFGVQTEAAVKGFQVGRALQADGIVGPLTWDELDDLEQIPTDTDWQRDIMATMFGGTADPNKSAYPPYDTITNSEMSVALPFRFPNDERPQIDVVNKRTGKRVTCDIRDIGPWNINDPYWATGNRPQAESGTDLTGRETNKAGIDLSPAAAAAIGLSGLEPVDWAFADSKPDEA